VHHRCITTSLLRAPRHLLRQAPAAMVGCGRRQARQRTENPAYRPATEKALETGLSLLDPIRRGLDTFPLRQANAAVSLEPLGPGARPFALGAVPATLRAAPGTIPRPAAASLAGPDRLRLPPRRPVWADMNRAWPTPPCF
jgi:hypothetical protein